MFYRFRLLTVLQFKIVAAVLLFMANTVPAQEVRQVIDVAEVWSGHPVGFHLLSRSNYQYVAFYDAERQMTVGMRPLTSTNWTLTRLPEKIGWDSHNYITFVMDREGYIHLSGNMHGSPMTYFRSEKPLDITTLKRAPMVGEEEIKTTYPKFFNGPAGEFLFTYRSGGSGNGIQIYNIYDPKTRAWKRLLQQPLIDGEGQKSAYPQGPSVGPDGFFHMIWIWRETPDCATSHYICYAKSRDLISWETSTGKKLQLPITFKTGEVVDPVPIKGGAINGNVHLGFDSAKRPIISYHKFDKDGLTQAYNARLEEGHWKIYQASDWDYRWEFGGGGSIVFEVRIGAVTKRSDGKLTQTVVHPKNGSGTWLLDDKTLKFTEKVQVKSRVPASLGKVTSSFPGIQVRQQTDRGNSRYVMRWETLPANRDRPRQGDLPEPSLLKIYEIAPSGE
ncbi:MAG: BNR-4 repeat-containing protein [Verrucomicrobia bacterium]|nr:BNR-4 repeat-containing protein [Verrucomicrobiota bacterium]